MKHLKEYINESILSSVNAGKQGIIEKWCEEHMLNFNKSRFELSSDNRIDYGKNTNDIGIVHFTGIKSKEDLPEYIKFGDMSKVEFCVSEFGKYMNNEQYPRYAKAICFGQYTTSENMDFLKKQFIVVNSDNLYFSKGVKNIKRIFWTSHGQEISLACRHSELRLKDFQNIQLVNERGGEVTVDLCGSNAGNEFSYDIFKINGENGDMKEKIKNFTDYVKKTFPSIENLTCVKFTTLDGIKFVEYKLYAKNNMFNLSLL